jgi:hypothetical protein
VGLAGWGSPMRALARVHACAAGVARGGTLGSDIRAAKRAVFIHLQELLQTDVRTPLSLTAAASWHNSTGRPPPRTAPRPCTQVPGGARGGAAAAGCGAPGARGAGTHTLRVLRVPLCPCPPACWLRRSIVRAEQPALLITGSDTAYVDPRMLLLKVRDSLDK